MDRSVTPTRSPTGPRLWEALQTLAPRQRAALVLRYYEDLTEAQTAEAMGCAVGTVKSQVSAGPRQPPTTLGDEIELVTNGNGAAR